MKNKKAVFSSERMDWETPDTLFDAINNVFRFEIDLCANADNAKMTPFFSEEDNSLSKVWDSCGWCNPPYGREQRDFVEKAANEDGTTVLLIPSRTDTRLWQDVVFKKSDLVIFLRGRVKFVGATSGAPFPTAVVVFNNKRSKKELEPLKVLGEVFFMKGGQANE